MLLSLVDIVTIVFKVFQKELNSIVCAYYTLDNNGHPFACQSVGRGRAEIHALMSLYHCWLKMQCVVWKVCKHKIVSEKTKVMKKKKAYNTSSNGTFSHAYMHQGNVLCIQVHMLNIKRCTLTVLV